MGMEMICPTMATAINGHKENQYGQTALFDELEPVLNLLLGGADHVVHRLDGQGKDADGVDHAQQKQKAVEVAGLGVDGGQRYIEIHKAYHSRDDQAHQQTAGPAHRLSGLIFFLQMKAPL